jgi:nucleotide-binding universal stress UspA family protein
MPSGLEDFSLTNEDAEWQAVSEVKGAATRSAAARTLFLKFSERNGYKPMRKPRATAGAVWMEKTGSPDRVIGIQGPLADLLIVSRPYGKGGSLARLFLSASLLKSGRPVLVLPQTGTRQVGRHICIAWNQGVEAAKAVAAALPLLSRAERVTIVSCGAEDRPGPKSGQLSSYLNYWGIASDHVATPGKKDTQEILAAYKSVGADLLVMGAYSRSRLSRLVFGGMTDYMLKHAKIPVLMLHS